MEQDKKQDEEFTKQLFFNQMTDFEQNTAEKITDILREEQYMLETEVLGLIATARAIAVVESHNDEALEALIDTAIYMLEQTKK